MLFGRSLKAGESIGLGKTAAEVDAAVDVIMGRKGADLADAAGPPAAIVVLDQNLDDYPAGQLPVVRHGTEIAGLLHKRGFRGLVCIRSGGSEADMATYAQAPGVTLALPKNGLWEDVATKISEAWWARDAAPGQ